MAQTSRRDFVKWLALTAAGAAALSEQILAFERRRLVELVDAGSEHVSLDATKHMLGIGGIAPAPSPSVNVA